MKIAAVIFTAVCLVSVLLYAQDHPAAAGQSQFILIVRSKADLKPSAEMVQSNIKHWQEFMGGLGRSGKLAGGYRPSMDGETISGKDKTSKPSFYVADGDVVSSFLIINAADMKQAREIAATCPVFELGGSVEVRPIQNTAR